MFQRSVRYGSKLIEPEVRVCESPEFLMLVRSTGKTWSIWVTSDIYVPRIVSVYVCCTASYACAKKERRGKGEERRDEQNTSFRIKFPTCGIECYLQLDCTKVTKKTLGPCLLLKNISCLLLEWNGENGSEVEHLPDKHNTLSLILSTVCAGTCVWEGHGRTERVSTPEQAEGFLFYSFMSSEDRLTM